MFSGRSQKTDTEEEERKIEEIEGKRNSMEEEIAMVEARYDLEKLALWEEIELREIREAAARHEEERSALLAEIARREAQSHMAPQVDDAARMMAVRARRHAMRLRKTLARGAASGLDPAAQKLEDERMAQEIREVNENNATVHMRVSGELSMLRRRPSKTVRRAVVWRKNASLRGSIRNAALRDALIASRG